jgi:hypothetical protein
MSSPHKHPPKSSVRSTIAITLAMLAGVAGGLMRLGWALHDWRSLLLYVFFHDKKIQWWVCGRISTGHRFLRVYGNSKRVFHSSPVAVPLAVISKKASLPSRCSARDTTTLSGSTLPSPSFTIGSPGRGRNG